MDEITVSSAVMTDAAAYASFHLAAHLRPLNSAVEANLVTSNVLFRRTAGMAIDSGLGSVVIVFDPIDGGTGPEGFNADLLESLISVADGIAVVSNIGSPNPYIWSVEAAVMTGGVVLLVETTTAQEQAWLDVVKRSRNPQNWTLWSTAVHGRA